LKNCTIGDIGFLVIISNIGVVPKGLYTPANDIRHIFNDDFIVLDGQFLYAIVDFIFKFWFHNELILGFNQIHSVKNV
jgi:hypothetical protein